VLWHLPVLFICENNLYAMGSALSITESITDFTRKASSYGISAVAVNGMDVLAVEAAAQNAVATIRAGGGPVFIEARTYRFRAHSMFDAELYRPKAEVEEWKKHGPLITFTTRMKAEGVITEDDFQAITRDVEREVAEAIAFAEAGTWEPVEDLLKFVHSEGKT
jgi:TPP-dependent pyruvate/acetoin dehydrogenase alpha subunit